MVGQERLRWPPISPEATDRSSSPAGAACKTLMPLESRPAVPVRRPRVRLTLPARIRFRVPEVAFQPKLLEDLPHFLGLWAAGIGLEPAAVPRLGKPPQLAE